MRALQKNWHLGQSLQAKVVEFVSKYHLIVSIDGHLVRVRNNSGQSFQQGDFIWLVVSGVHPLAFRITTQRKDSFHVRV